MDNSNNCTENIKVAHRMSLKIFIRTRDILITIPSYTQIIHIP